ncbi:hypothetical protein GCK72_007201 [Caenorhabditis remanei]|uniref:T-box domain-containing protein n=1 Tax=Caenorhabditis remanei TaxID=31234 RepID=A0A6A5HN91_CAERE|nr:hypothetical protein GCK72_007201 [Caenorhabditis remanei]KAF1767242.1 hypothetical protein GCK72_007201 [Caenorhabditis remanei]
MTTASGIELSLSNPDEWKQFYPQTEMIVTRKGRKLFPHLNYSLKGLDPNELYGIFIHFERVDINRYQFLHNKWNVFGKGDEVRPIKAEQHLDGWRAGSYWMTKPISFEHVRITNDPDLKKPNTFVLQSMHKFMPVIGIQKMGDSKIEGFRLEVTEFMAVTAYQNNDIKELKIQMNRFASGFKDTGGHNKSRDSGSSPRGVKRQSTSPEVYGSVTPPTAPWTPPYNPWTPMSYNDMYPMYPMYPWQMPMGMYPMVPPMSSGMAPGVPMNSSMPPVADVFQNQPAMQQNPMYMGWGSFNARIQ